jgi:hypothetical protein
MGVVAETGAAADYIERGESIDEVCDRVTADAVRQADALLRALSLGDIEAAKSYARRERADLMEIERLDRLEGFAWQHEAPQHIHAARGEGRAIIAACQPGAELVA